MEEKIFSNFRRKIYPEKAREKKIEKFEKKNSRSNSLFSVSLEPLDGFSKFNFLRLRPRVD